MIPYIEINFTDIANKSIAIPTNLSHIDTNKTIIILGLPTIMFYKMVLDFESSHIVIRIDYKQHYM